MYCPPVLSSFTHNDFARSLAEALISACKTTAVTHLARKAGTRFCHTTYSTFATSGGILQEPDANTPVDIRVCHATQAIRWLRPRRLEKDSTYYRYATVIQG